MALMFEGGYMSRKPLWSKEERVCVKCGKTFYPHVANQKTCSKECGQLLAIERKREMGKIYYENKRASHGKARPANGCPGARHIGSKSERKDAVLEKVKRKRNMEELARIANLSNGDYGKWVAQNDNGRTKE